MIGSSPGQSIILILCVYLSTVLCINILFVHDIVTKYMYHCIIVSLYHCIVEWVRTYINFMCIS